MGNNQKPIEIIRFENVGNDADFPIRLFFDEGPSDQTFSENEWHCVAAGWTARYNVTSTSTGNNLIWTYVNQSVWYVHAEINSDGPHENPDIDVVCFRVEIANWSGFRDKGFTEFSDAKYENKADSD